MVRILIKNSFCRVEGASPTALKVIKDALTYDNQEKILELRDIQSRLNIAFSRGLHKLIRALKAQEAKVRSEITTCWFDGKHFPTGLLGYVQDILAENKIDYELKDLRRKPPKSIHYPEIKGYESRPYQKEAVEAFLEASRGVIEASVGSGKTYMMQCIIQKLGVPAMIITPAVDLNAQIADSCKQVFGSKFVAEIKTNTMSASALKKPIKVVTIHTLKSLKRKRLLRKVISDIDLVIFDEFHHAGAKSYTDLLKDLAHVYYRAGFTGTMRRNDSRSMDMYGVLSKKLYSYTAKQGIKEGYLTPLKVIMYRLPGKRASNYQMEFKKNYCGGIVLLEKIKEIAKENKEKQILILVARKDTSGKLIHDYLAGEGIKSCYISGDDKKDVIKKALKDFNDKKINILIGSSIIGEGIDIRSTDHLIMAQGGKSNIAIPQAVGRALRKFKGKDIAYIHDFYFLGTKVLEKHADMRVKMYASEFTEDIEVRGE